MLILVTSASGINGNGYGALLAFKHDGTLIGPFNDDSRIVDPRGLAMDQKEGLLFLNSGGDRVLALGPNGTTVRDTGPIARLNPGGGNFGPDGHLVRVFSPTKLAEFRKPRGLRFGPDGHLYCVAQDEVVAFDFTKGACLGTTVQFQRLNGQALAFFP
jgi:hypothetical protein